MLLYIEAIRIPLKEFLEQRQYILDTSTYYKLGSGEIIVFEDLNLDGSYLTKIIKKLYIKSLVQDKDGCLFPT